MVRQVYTREYKIKAIEVLESSNKPLRQVARELGVAENNLYNWRKTIPSQTKESIPKSTSIK